MPSSKSDGLSHAYLRISQMLTTRSSVLQKEREEKESRRDRASHRVHQRAHQAPPLEQKWRTKRAPPFLSDPGNKGPV